MYLEALYVYGELQNWFTGKEINIAQGSLDVNREGFPIFDSSQRPKFLPGKTLTTYRLSAANNGGVGYIDQGAAAFDAIAMARAVGAAIGDTGEWTGYIIENSDAGFGYEYNTSILTGQGAIRVSKSFSLGRDFKGKFDSIPREKVVGAFHTHPVGGGDVIANAFMSWSTDKEHLDDCGDRVRNNASVVEHR